MQVSTLVTLPMEDAPTLADAGIDPLRLRRQSHILQARRKLLRGRICMHRLHGRDGSLSNFWERTALKSLDLVCGW